MKSKIRSGQRADILTLAASGVFILLMGALLILLPKERILERENRVAASLPRFSIERLASGKFAEDVSSYCSDHLPFRELMIGARSAVGYSVFGGFYGGTVRGRDGYLLDVSRYGEDDHRRIGQNLSDFTALGEASGLSCHMAVIPRGADVMKCKISHLLDERDGVWEYLPEGALTFDAELSALADWGEYVWYKTDHHYTTLGAYYVYLALADRLGYEAYPIEHFTRQAVSGEFLGTTFSSSGLYRADPDEITLFRYADDSNFTVSYGEVTMSGFYDGTALEGRDKYSVFLGGNHGITRIKKEGESRPCLIVIKDSYAHALSPFLALHYDLLLIDPRYYKESIDELIASENAVGLLLLCGIDTLATADLGIR